MARSRSLVAIALAVSEAALQIARAGSMRKCLLKAGQDRPQSFVQKLTGKTAQEATTSNGSACIGPPSRSATNALASTTWPLTQLTIR
jgi:hypothetical protein